MTETPRNEPPFRKTHPFAIMSHGTRTEPNGGYLRGHARDQVALRDGLTGSLRPGLAEFAATY